MTGNSDLVDLTLHQHAETDRAVLVSDDGTEARAVWLPKSQIEIAPLPGTGGAKGLVLVTAPQWLLEDKGLV